ncbi:hypothetical protein CMV14_18825 [Rhizorhabdus dicambivorans]|nr:hypothetical protein CMV14_18825 [Rhizorhabdus dicambivorans]
MGVRAGAPKLILSTLLPTHREGDRLSLEPYRVAYETAQAPHPGAVADPATAVAEGRRRQDMLAEAGLRNILHALERAEGTLVRAGLLVNRAGWVTDLLDYSLSWPEHVPVAEALAVREALRSGLSRCGIGTVELDEKSLADRAAQALALSPVEIDAQLKAFGATAGKPWRKEQKLACLAAWLLAVDAPITGSSAS